MQYHLGNLYCPAIQRQRYIDKMIEQINEMIMEYSFDGKYYVYIVTNDSKDTFEIGTTGDLSVLIHRLDKSDKHCNQLIH